LILAGIRTLETELTLIQRGKTYFVRECQVLPYGKPDQRPIKDKDAGIAALQQAVVSAGLVGRYARMRCTRFGC
jgi:hypothetical protein